MSTIKEVARLAGVSVATVSRVINKNQNVSFDTTLKVQRVIDELNYIPNSIAVSLNSKKTKTIGLILPDITNPFFPEMAKAVEEVVRDRGYSLILCNSDGALENEIEHINMLEKKFVDGIILASNFFSKQYYKNYKTPIVLIDRKADSEFSSVTSNNFSGAVLATKHLLDVGCKKIAHITGPPSVITASDRLGGYLSIASKYSWYSKDLLIHADYEIHAGYLATKQLLQNVNGVDGIFAGNDLIAVGCMKAVYAAGLKVPDDIAIIGFDGIAFSKILIPELSTIAQPIYDLGSRAADILLDEIEENSHEKTFLKLDVELVIRESTKRKKRGE